MPVQSSCFACSRKAVVIRFESLSTGFNALVIYHLTGKSMPVHSNCFACSRKAVVIRSESLSTGFNALVIHHLKHSTSRFCMLTIAFLIASFSGSGMYEAPRNRIVNIEPLDRHESPLPRFRKLALDSRILSFALLNNSPTSVAPIEKPFGQNVSGVGI